MTTKAALERELAETRALLARTSAGLAEARGALRENQRETIAIQDELRRLQTSVDGAMRDTLADAVRLRVRVCRMLGLDPQQPGYEQAIVDAVDDLMDESAARAQLLEELARRDVNGQASAAPPSDDAAKRDSIEHEPVSIWTLIRTGWPLTDTGSVR
jgi:hypothetical protein